MVLLAHLCILPFTFRSPKESWLRDYTHLGVRNLRVLLQYRGLGKIRTKWLNALATSSSTVIALGSYGSALGGYGLILGGYGTILASYGFTLGCYVIILLYDKRPRWLRTRHA